MTAQNRQGKPEIEFLVAAAIDSKARSRGSVQVVFSLVTNDGLHYVSSQTLIRSVHFEL